VFADISTLPDWHVEALEWFQANAGRVFPDRPRNVGLPIAVTDPQSGIWKPRGTDYAVSVLQTHKHRYPDMPPYFVQGTWVYQYHQEGEAAEGPYERYANRALMQCKADGIPVGVVLPAPEAGPRAYKVVGLGFVDRYEEGYFVISGPAEVSDTGFLLGEAPPEETLQLITFAAEDSAAYEGVGEKQRVLASVVRRQGQPHFRRQLLMAYDGRCAMSEYDAEDALEAAHIDPYSGPGSNSVGNGLLLRSDMHDLFDLGLVAVDTSHQVLLLGDKLGGTRYESYAGRRLHLPNDRKLWPSTDRLDHHREVAGL
jgi:hypothetical protein